jgi:MFS family permease
VTSPEIPSGEPGRSRRISVVEGAFATVHATITAGSLVTAYALWAGANDFHLGLLAALTAISGVGSILGAHWVGHLGKRKPLAILASVGGRALWGVLCFLPFLPLPPAARIAIFLTVVFLGNGLLNGGATAWLSWMTDLVPAERRGRFFGRRNALLGVVGMGAAWSAGRIYDGMVAAGRARAGLALVFGAAVACSVIAGVILTRQWEPPLAGEQPRPLIETIRRPLANRDFRRLLGFLVAWAAVTGIAGPFYGAHMIRNLRMPFSVIAIYSILAGVVSLLTQPLWGRIIDRAGNRPVLICNLAGLCLLPAIWLLATPDRWLPIWIDAVITGVFWPGMALAAFNLLLATVPTEGRAACLGAHSLGVGLGAFVAGLLGGWVAEALAGFHARVCGIALVNFHLLFLLSAAARVALLPFAFGLREERAQSVTALLGFMGDKTTQEVGQWLRAGASAVEWMGRRRR